MPALLLLALVVVPIAELYVIIQVGQQIGALPTVVLLVVVSVLGTVLLRREGARTWRAFQAATSAGRVPAREVVDGALVVLGGALLLTPGFLSDVVGLLLVLPPTRALLRGSLTSWALRRMVPPTARGGQGALGGFGRPGGPGGPGRRPRGRGVVDGEVVRDDPPPP